MNLRFSGWLSGLALSVLTISLLLSGNIPAAEKHRGHPIEFSDAKGADIGTNVNQLSPKLGILKELEDELTKSFHQSFSSHSSMEGVVVPPPSSTRGPMMPNKKLKEQMERKRNWWANSPEDLSTTTPTAEEVLKLPEYAIDDEKKPRSSVESYLQRLERKAPKTVSKAAKESDRDEINFFGLPKQSDLPEDADLKKESDRATQNDRTLRNLFDAKSGNSYSAPESMRSPVSDLFGLGVVPATPEQLEAQKIYQEKFKALVGLPTLTTAGAALPSSLSGLPDLRPVAPPVAPPPDSGNVFNSRPGGFDGVSSIFGAAALPAGLPDLLAKPASPFAVPATLPKADPPKWNIPTGPAAGFNLQRAF